MLIKRTWAARLAALTLGTALACGPGVALADEQSWGLDGEAVDVEANVGEAPQDDSQFAGEVLFAEEASQAEASQAEASTGLQVNYHSQEEIKSLFLAVGLSFDQPIAYDQEPVVTAPYGLGQLSDETVTQATAMLNFYRYVAGLDAIVIPDEEYSQLSQAGALLMAATKDMSHGGQAQPEGMSNDLYDLGIAGTSQSNIAMGYDNLQSAIAAWVDDSGESNIASVGHRRWILNPTMAYTGFGAVSSTGSANGFMYYDMYAFDKSNTEATQTMAAWPAQNTPVELTAADTPWSLSLDSVVSSDTVRVQVTSVSTGKTWNFSPEAADGAFYVTNGYYGSLPGCIIFQPEGIDISAGQSYDVTVTGIDTPVQYRVNFFYITDALTSITLDSNKLQDAGGGVLKPLVTVKAGDRVLVEGQDYTLTMSYGADSALTVTAIGINNYHGTVEVTFTPEKPGNGHVTIDKNDTRLPGRWVSSQGKWWYQYINGTYPCSKWAFINGSWYYFDNDGWMQTGWQLIDGEWYYMNGSGAMQTGWQRIGGTWYYLNGSGVMQTGWLSSGGVWYYLKSSGAMATGWQLVDDTWYYLNGSGAMQTGWQKISGTWYYMNSSGAMQTGWEKIGGVWYYLKPSGAMATGWQSVDGTWYYMNASGAMQANRWVGNYYVTASGAMATNQWIGNYYVGNDGAWIPNPSNVGAGSEDKTSADKTELVWWTPSGDCYHVQDCPTLERSKRLISGSLAEAEATGHTPCSVCR